MHLYPLQQPFTNLRQAAPQWRLASPTPPATCRRFNGRRYVCCNAVVVGIDLGTSNSAVAIIQDGQAVVLPDETRPGDTGVMPSVVTYTQHGEVLVGYEALAAGRRDPANTFFSVKRLTGRSYADLEASGAPQRLPYLVGDAGDGAAALCCPALGDGVWLRPEDVSAHLLRALVGRAERALGETVESAVVTVPARFTPGQREATLRAARAAGLTEVQLLQEPVAAALAHGALAQGGHSATVLVLDLGGGTADVSIVTADEGVLECIATGGDDWLGGDDWDEALLAHLLGQLPREVADAVRADPVAMQRVRLAAEQAKVQLSSRQQVEVHIPGLVAAVPGVKATALVGSGGSGGIDLRTGLSRGCMDACSAGLRARLVELLVDMGTDTHLAWADNPEVLLQELLHPHGDGVTQAAAAAIAAEPAAPTAVDMYAPPPRRITHSVLVGGASRMPSVRSLVARLSGAHPLAGPDPEQAVALGAATHAGMVLGLVAGLEARDGAYLPGMHGRVSGFVGS